MGEGILRSLLESESVRGVEVASAGTVDIPTIPASPLARDVAAAHGIDLSDHRSRHLTAEAAVASDLILAMTREHLDWIIGIAPDVGDRAFLLSEYADGKDIDVPDPIGGPLVEYETVYDMIENLLRRGLPRIVEAAGEKGR